MDDQPFEDDERNALASLADTPPHRKAHSYSQQLRSNTGTHIKKRHHQIRKHSLDDTSKNIISINSSTNYGYYIENSSDDDDEFYPYSTSSTGTTTTTAGAAAGNGVEFFHQGSQTYDAMPVGDGMNQEFRQQQQQQTLPEFVGTGGGVGIFKVPIRAAVHPSRPTCLELRPHPLRETQVRTSKLTGNLTCSLILIGI